jgi:hypothetical protein
MLADPGGGDNVFRPGDDSLDLRFEYRNMPILPPWPTKIPKARALFVCPVFSIVGL